jgi:glycosyltransferase involved in cell wall biosynthesis
MRILITTGYRSIVGGIETYLQVLIPALLERGHRVALVCDYDAAGKPTVDPVDADLPFWGSDELMQNSGSWSDLTHWAPDVVYSQGLFSPEIDRALQLTYPTVLYAHNYWGTCTTGRKCHAFPNVQACERTFGPMCLLYHYPRRCGGLNPILAWKMFGMERSRNARLPDYRAVLVASTHMRREFQRHGVDPEKLHLVPLPLEDNDLPVAVSAKIPGGRLLFLGRLTALKGVDLLIRAIHRAETKLGRKLFLTVAGDGPEMEKLRGLALQDNLAVKFTGWVDHSLRAELIAQSDLLVVPSLWPEPFGMVGIEAGKWGVPAAGFALGGIPDWLLPGNTGELAPGDPPTSEGLADAIQRALDNQDHYQKLCGGALEFSRQFTVRRHIEELEGILQDQAFGTAPRTRLQLSSLNHDR